MMPLLLSAVLLGAGCAAGADGDVLPEGGSSTPSAEEPAGAAQGNGTEAGEPDAPAFEIVPESQLGPEKVDAYSNHYSPETLERDLDELAEAYAGQIALGSYGESVNGRSLRFAQIGSGSRDIVFTGGIHAREYLSSVATMNVLEEFLRLQKAGNPEIAELLSEYRVWFLPSLNPDGAVISQSGEATDIKANANHVDLNRNFAEGWDGFVGSPAGSIEFYKGPAPLSEPETQAVVAFFESPGKDVAYSIEMHTMGNVIYRKSSRGGETQRLAEAMSRSTGFPILEDPSMGANLSDFLAAVDIPTITIEFGDNPGMVVYESQGPGVKAIVQKFPLALHGLACG
jgi:g-D-glutamyl-meso-diaminopimelate peptidase